MVEFSKCVSKGGSSGDRDARPKENYKGRGRHFSEWHVFLRNSLEFSFYTQTMGMSSVWNCCLNKFLNVFCTLVWVYTVHTSRLFILVAAHDFLACELYAVCCHTFVVLGFYFLKYTFDIPIKFPVSIRALLGWFCLQLISQAVVVMIVLLG